VEQQQEKEEPNFEIYVGNETFSKERVQIKLVKDFKNKK